MPSSSLHIVRAESYAQGGAGRILTLAEARAAAETPPSHAVEWLVSERNGSRSVRCFAQIWSEARALGAAELGANHDQVTCARVIEALPLSGKGVA
jgi:hypothetical protein